MKKVFLFAALLMAYNSIQAGGINVNIGIQHNQGLDFFIKNCNKGNPHESFISVNARFISENGISSNQEATSVLTALKSNTDMHTLIHATDQPAAFLKIIIGKTTGPYNPFPLWQEFAAAYNASNAIEATVKLKSLETQIQSNTSLSASDKADLLNATRVSISSISYWDLQSLNPLSPWKPIIDKNGAIAGIKWWKLALADAAGAIFGGGVAGALGGTVGELIGEL